jgi:hypothetical protein
MDLPTSVGSATVRNRSQAVLVLVLALVLVALAASLVGSTAYSGGTTTPSVSPLAVDDLWGSGVAIVPHPLLVIPLAFVLTLVAGSTATQRRVAAKGARPARAPPSA